jgi:replicative DNA helicase
MTEQLLAYKVPQLYSIEIEQAVLGGLLIDPGQMAHVIHMIDESDFYLEKHRIIWNMLVALYSEGKAIDVLTLTDEATARGVIEQAGGNVYPTELIMNTPTSFHTQWYAQHLREYRVKREMVAACQAGVAAAFNGNDVSMALSDLRKATMTAERMLVGDVTSLHHRQSLDSYMDLMETRYANRNNSRLIFPWPGLAALMPYLEGGDLVGVLAEPGVGKTAFLECCAEAWAQSGWKVAFFHFELSTQRMLDRRMQRQAGVPIKRLQDGGQTEDDDYTAIARTVSAMSKWTGDIEYIHCPGWPMSRVVSHIQRQHERTGMDVAIVDYLNKVRMVERGNMNSAQCRGADIEDFKVALEELGIVGLIAGQFDKAAKRMRTRSLADARDTGELEDKANVGIVIDRQRDQRGARSALAKVNVVKCNAGVEGQVQMVFDGGRLAFVEKAHEHREPPDLWED